MTSQCITFVETQLFKQVDETCGKIYAHLYVAARKVLSGHVLIAVPATAKMIILLLG